MDTKKPSAASSPKKKGVSHLLSIKISPKNKGKFNTTKKRTGETTEELTHSSNPVTKKRAIFAQNFGGK